MNTSLKIKNHGYTRTVVNGKPIHDVKWAEVMEKSWSSNFRDSG